MAVRSDSFPRARDDLRGTIDRQLGRQRLFAWMLGLLGTIGFVLAAVGLHGLIGQTVVERRRPGRRPGARVVQWTPRRESAVRGDEPRSVAVRLAALLMIAVVCLASISPAIAATRVDPLEVLKSE